MSENAYMFCDTIVNVNHASRFENHSQSRCVWPLDTEHPLKFTTVMLATRLTQWTVDAAAVMATDRDACHQTYTMD